MLRRDAKADRCDRGEENDAAHAEAPTHRQHVGRGEASIGEQCQGDHRLRRAPLHRDQDTGEIFDRTSLNGELEKIEKPAGISNPKDFRNEIVNFVLRARANNGGKNPTWTSYEKLRTVIEKKMFSNTEELLPVISFNAKASVEDAKKHEDFVNRMVEKGYTAKLVRLLCEWYLRVRKSS